MGQASKRRSFEYRRNVVEAMVSRQVQTEIEDDNFEALIRKGIICIETDGKRAKPNC